MAKPRDYKAEYARRKARGIASGKSPREATGHYQRGAPGPRPRSGQSPRGIPLVGSKAWSGPECAEAAEPWIDRLGPNSIVHVYARVSIGGDVDTYQLFPHGGIRAGTLQTMIANEGLEEVIVSTVVSGRVAQGSNPGVNPQNRREKSPRFKPGEGDGEPEIIVHQVVIQWTRK